MNLLIISFIPGEVRESVWGVLHVPAVYGQAGFDIS